jgi:hypothetical protein
MNKFSNCWEQMGSNLRGCIHIPFIKNVTSKPLVESMEESYSWKNRHQTENSYWLTGPPIQYTVCSNFNRKKIIDFEIWIDTKSGMLSCFWSLTSVEYEVAAMGTNNYSLRHHFMPGTLSPEESLCTSMFYLKMRKQCSISLVV